MIARRPRHRAREFGHALANAAVFTVSLAVLVGCLVVFLWIVIALVLVLGAWIDK